MPRPTPSRRISCARGSERPSGTRTRPRPRPRRRPPVRHRADLLGHRKLRDVQPRRHRARRPAPGSARARDRVRVGGRDIPPDVLVFRHRLRRRISSTGTGGPSAIGSSSMVSSSAPSTSGASFRPGEAGGADVGGLRLLLRRVAPLPDALQAAPGHRAPCEDTARLRPSLPPACLQAPRAVDYPTDPRHSQRRAAPSRPLEVAVAQPNRERRAAEAASRESTAPDLG
jgi:hypothetical protein